MGLRALAVALFLLGSLSGGAARAADPPKAEDPVVSQARDEFVQGTDLAKKARWSEALALFEHSARLRPHPTTTYNVGVCKRVLGAYTQARDLFEDALRTTDGAVFPESLATEARGYVAEIDRVLARVTITIDPPNAGIAIDGRPLRPSATAAIPVALVAGVLPPGPGIAPPAATFEVLLDPGTHVLTLSRKGYTDVLVTKTFAPGARERTTLNLALLPATLHISSNLAGTVVTVNGADVGVAPIDVSRPAGSYRIVAKRDGFATYEAQVNVLAGEETDFRATMVAEKVPVTKRWWFWTGAAAVIAGGVAITYALTRNPQPPAYDSGTAKWLVTPQGRPFVAW